MAEPLVRMECKQQQIGSRYCTASILGLLEGSAWLQQSPRFSVLHEWGIWSGFKAQPCTSIPSSIYPSIATAWSSTATLPYLKLQKPLMGGLSPMQWQSSNVNPSAELGKLLKSSLKGADDHNNYCLYTKYLMYKNGWKFCSCGLKHTTTSFHASFWGQTLLQHIQLVQHLML